MLEEKAYGKDLEDLRAKLGLNRPLYVQYFEWPGQVVRGDLGESLWTRRPVLEELARRLPVRLELAVLALTFALLIARARSASSPPIRQDTLATSSPRSAAILGLSVPGFWMATLCDRAARDLVGLDAADRSSRVHPRPLAATSPQFLLPAFILGIAVRRGHHAPDARHAARGAAPGLRAHRVGQGAARAGRGAQARPEERA